MTYTTYKIKRFIRKFNFANPTWETLPTGFPNFDKTGLTREEGHLLDGIKLAWMAGEGRSTFYGTVARKAVFIAVIVFVLFVGKNIITSSQTITKTVSAKTVSRAVGEIVEATRSAIFK